LDQQRFLTGLGRLYPQKSSESWDFPGYQTGKKHLRKPVRKVFLCLDFTEDCLAAAQAFRPDIILTHHPFFFGKKSVIRKEDPKKAALEKAILSLSAPLYSYHTDFDKGEGGMNDTLLALLGYERISVAPDGLMRLALRKEPADLPTIAEEVKKAFALPYVFYFQGQAKKIQKIALIAGGGADLYPEAIALGADLYISGDCAHHTRVDLKRYGISYLDISHEVEEIGFLTGMGKVLLSLDPTLQICRYAYEKPFDLLA
jgi:dinuclear metal center YbgI/SA1388 family protein